MDKKAEAQREDMHKVTCQTYAALKEGKRCRHFKQGGNCTLKTQKCIEWLKVNNRDLFGHPLPAAAPAKPKPAPEKSKGATTQEPVQAPEPPVVRNITDEEIASFKALGAEVCLATDAGDIWLVPEYKDDGRQEILIEHAATLAVLCSAFNGARISRFEKINPT